MRLTADQQIIIKNTALNTLGPKATVRVFGSRLHDDSRGGDIDLLFETPALLPRKATAICQLYAALIVALGDQKIDVLLKDARPSTASVIDHAQRHRTIAVSLSYLPEYAAPALHALDLAIKERSYLAYSASSLAKYTLDSHFITLTQAQPELAEKIDAFVSRFGRLQDHVGDKLLPAFALLLDEKSPSSASTH